MNYVYYVVINASVDITTGETWRYSGTGQKWNKSGQLQTYFCLVNEIQTISFNNYILLY
jgi:hypothetical protein